MSRVRVGFRCDAGPRIGVGHLVRCVALAEELVGRGVDVHFLSDLGGVGWARRQLTRRRLPCHRAPTGPADTVAAVADLGLDAVVLDSYHLPPAIGVALRAAGHRVLAIVDGDLRGQHADVYVDQNLDAELLDPPLPPDAVRLAGLRYALLRAEVRRLRPATLPAVEQPRVPRVVAFFGGTDAYRAAPVIGRLLIAAGAPFDATIIAADDASRAELTALGSRPGRRITVIAPTDELPALLARADLVISASGTSTWELLCLGLPAALVWVVDNQILGYERTVRQAMAAGLGHLPSLAPGSTPWEQATTRLYRLLTHPGDRAALADKAFHAVDGRGTERVADALLLRRTATEP